VGDGLQIRGLAKRYGDIQAVADLSLHVPRGELIGFLGPNGAGKTTTMRAIMGMVRPDAGTIMWDGRPVDDDVRHRVGYMPQERGLYPRMKAHAQVAYFARLAGHDKATANDRASYWLERVGLTDRADDLVQELSGGNQQRVQLGVALVHEPDLLVLDEPFGGLDPLAAETMRAIIAERAEQGASVLFSSHQLDLVEGLCEHVVIVAEGRLVAAGAIADLRRAAPTRRLVVGWSTPVGEWQPLVGELESHTGRAATAILPASCDVAANIAHAAAAGPIESVAIEPPPHGGDPMIWTIAKRELTTRGLSKGYIIITSLLFVGVIVVGLLVTLFSGDDSAREVTVGIDSAYAATDGGAILTELLSPGTDDLDPTIVELSDGVAGVEAGDVDVFFDGTTLTWEGLPDNQIDVWMRQTAQRVGFERNASGLGLSPSDLGTLFAQDELEEVRLDGGEDQFGMRLAIAGASAMATFMLLQIWGSFMMMGVIEEKSSKVIEVLLSHVRPRTLLSGKMLGLGILALVQMLILVLAIVVSLVLTRDVEVPSGVWRVVPLLVPTFLLSFAFYASAFAAVGSMVSRQEDAQSAQLPAMLPLMAGYVIGVASFTNPDNPAAVIGSFVPFTSPVLLPLRSALSDLPVWQAVVSLAILAISTVIMLRIAGSIYRYSLLRSGTRVKFGEAWRNRAAAEV